MKCVYVCVSVCLFRYVGIVSCRYIKETHGMKDDDNDNDREKNGNFGNSFHFRQIHTHTMDEFDFKRRNISTLNGPEFNWWWNWLTMTHPRNPSKTKLNNLSMAVCVSAEQCATAKPISIQAINEPERKKNRTTKKFYWLNGWTLMVNKHSDYDKYIAMVWLKREREGECSISKWIDLLCCICVTKFLPLNDSSMSNVIFYSLHQFAWPSNLLTWLNMDCELAGQVNLARDFTTQNNWDCVRLLPSPSNQFFFISFAFPWKFESDFNANKPFRAQMNFSRNRNNVLVFNAF